MADFTFNVALGKVGGYYDRVQTNDPANSALLVLALDTTGLESDATLKDVDTLTALVAGTTNEATNSGYARLTLVDTDLAVSAPDDGADSITYDIADQTFPAVLAGNSWSKIVICYDPDTTGGTDANVIPLTCHDFTSTPDGSDIIVGVPNGFLVAS